MLVALGLLLRRESLGAILILIWAAVIFRFELSLLLFFVIFYEMQDFKDWKSSVKTMARHFLVPLCKLFNLDSSPIFEIAISILFDSLYWKRPLWPEWEVFKFNGVQNQSFNWGVSPWHWYFTKALPKISLALMPISLMGIVMDKMMMRVAGPVAAFVSALSVLPHKELRFIFPAIPILNASAAVFLAKQTRSNHLKKGTYMAIGVTIIIVLTQIGTTALKLYVSSLNYPGGDALVATHTLLGDSQEVALHMDTKVTMTGISRFLHLDPSWRYTFLLKVFR